MTSVCNIVLLSALVQEVILCFFVSRRYLIQSKKSLLFFSDNFGNFLSATESSDSIIHDFCVYSNCYAGVKGRSMSIPVLLSLVMYVCV